MPLIKEGKIVRDDWRFVTKTAPDYADQTIRPLSDLDDPDCHAVWLDADTEIEDFVKQLLRLDLIAIKFETFADGRGLSLATLLRSRHGFGGEIRAFGHVLPDLTPFMLRSGFDAFLIESSDDAETAIRCMSAVKHFYQGSTLEPEPSYRRVHRT